MASHSSATTREHTPHVNRTTRTNAIVDALKRRAQVVLNDSSIDPQSRALIRYALAINDPWLAELVRRADAGEAIVDAIDFSETPPTSDDQIRESKIQTLTYMICRADEAETKSAALLVLLATIENATHPQALANIAKHLVFDHCVELNVDRMVDAQAAVFANELLASNSLLC